MAGKDKPSFYASHHVNAITQADIDEYANHYSALGGMHAGFEYYRAFPQDAIQNMNYSKTELTTPVLAVQGGYSPALVQQVSDLSTINYVLNGIKLLAENVTGIIVPNSGHSIPEEQPEFVIDQLSSFFGNSTNGTD